MSYLLFRILGYRLNLLFVIWAIFQLKISAVYSDSKFKPPEWGVWREWSECTRECGIGISNRTRECILDKKASGPGEDSNGSPGIGVYRFRRNFYYRSLGRGRNLFRDPDYKNSKCNGDDVEYQTCNIEPCDESLKDFRTVQCEKHNKKHFNGRRYRWEPFLAPDPCTLTCKARGYGFYAKLGNRVIDGTPCREGSNDVCVAGRCQRVGCDGVLGSFLRFDKCGKCGGDGTSCRVVSGTFVRPRLPFGYNPVVTIPEGACNINITETQWSRNYIALKFKNSKKYIINGHWRIDWSKDVYAAGTTFKYRRPPSVRSGYQEHVVAKGPINESIEFMILYQHRNPGVKYGYTLPYSTHDTDTVAEFNRYRSESSSRYVVNPQKGSSNKRNRGDNSAESGSYKETSFDKESGKNDGSNPGLNDNSDKPVNDQRDGYNNQGSYRVNDKPTSKPVTTVEKPVSTNQHANLKKDGSKKDLTLVNKEQPSESEHIWRSTFVWRVSGFTDCSRTCGEGIQTTIVRCVMSRTLAVVTEENCEARSRPSEQRLRCNTRPCPPDWYAGDWSSCSLTCGQGKQTRRVQCRQRVSERVSLLVSADQCNHKTMPHRWTKCNNPECYKWAVGNWGRCSVPCGKGKHSRDVNCVDASQNKVEESKCKSSKPKKTRECEIEPCKKQWMATKWTDQCSEGCGDGIFKRKVLCTKDTGICDQSQKPAIEKPCTGTIRCGAMWFAGPWSKCSEDCSSTTQKRQVLCMKKIGSTIMLAMPYECNINEKPEEEISCNRPSCDAEWYMAEWSDCSSTCGTGIQYRELRCLNSEGEPSTNCADTERPSTTKECKKTDCPKEVPLDPGCSNSLTRNQCRTVVQARLCSYEYYSNLCCEACTLHRRRGRRHKRRSRSRHRRRFLPHHYLVKE